VGGETPPVRSDGLFLVNNNAGGNKADLFLERRLTYDAKLSPAAHTVDVRAKLGVALDNGTPATGWPVGVIGPYSGTIAAGENDSQTSVYTPLGLRGAQVNGKPVQLEAAAELRRNAFWGFLRMPSKSTTNLDMDLEGRVALQPGGWYELSLVHQPTVNSDRIRVNIEVPDGWQIAETLGMTAVSTQRAEADIRLQQDTTVGIRLTQLGVGSFWRRWLP
jgi:hypothetical protein